MDPLPRSIACRARSTMAWRMRILSGAWPPGMTSASKSSILAAAAATSAMTTAWPRFPRNSVPAAGPTSVTTAPAARSASSGPVSSRSSKPSSTSIAIRLPASAEESFMPRLLHNWWMNRLAAARSPYLLQHADNPVEWFEWGDDAFARARSEDKPIFLSIGYSTCHWCHVMAHESFESADVAAILNEHFVSIKVDREERPDVDRVYMTFVQATTGSGGWPMSVWLTPNLQPFVGGTYFPSEDRYGQPAFKKVLERIAAAWKQDHEKIVDQSSKIIDALRESQTARPTAAGKIDINVLQAAYDQFARSFDEKEGGFGTAPKFPRPVTLNFLTRFYARNPKSESGKHAREMDLSTLRKMAAGGMHDHLGGGFHRYSVDRYWHVPHFEKMLYDQAQLASAYIDALQITNDPPLHPLPGQGEEDAKRQVRVEFEAVARDILDYVARDMVAK